jgi:hypothetical protein
MPAMKTRIALLLAVLLSVACDNPAPGEACEVTGDGFTRQDPCADTCVTWDVTCPAGDTVAPSVCSDGACSTDADCDSGWFCAEINMTDSECLPLDVCPTDSSPKDSGDVADPSAPGSLEPPQVSDF